MANTMCFGCGKDNPQGLNLKCRLTADENAYEVEFTPQDWHQGYDGIIHGGILTTVLDELSADFLRAKGKRGVTARLDVRFREPVLLGDTVYGRAEIEKVKGPLYTVVSKLVKADGTPAVEAVATIMVKD